MYQQLKFETERVGTDGTLWDVNTLEYGLTRGVIGEAQEALEEVRNGNIDRAAEEVIDILIFLGSILVHLGMDATSILNALCHKIEAMQNKYRKEHFQNRTVKEGLLFSREVYEKTRTGAPAVA